MTKVLLYMYKKFINSLCDQSTAAESYHYRDNEGRREREREREREKYYFKQFNHVHFLV